MAEKRKNSKRSSTASIKRLKTKASGSDTIPESDLQTEILAQPDVGPDAHNHEPTEDTQDKVETSREPSPLPTTFNDSHPLPTLSAPQPDLLLDDYRSYELSNVLLASLHKSRQSWLSGTHLPRYWAKPSSKKDAPPPPPDNPQRAWMKEIGSCTIIVEPLILEATVYYSREPSLVQTAQKSTPSAPQATIKQSKSQPPQPSTNPGPSHPTASARPPSNSHAPFHPLAPSPYGPLYRPHIPGASSTPQPSSRLGPISTPVHSPRPSQPPSLVATPVTTRPVTPLTNPSQTPARSTGPPTTAPVSGAASPASVKAYQNNQVVQMLATRASADPVLKALMQVVAVGEANREQLQAFQRHIDDINATMRAQARQTQGQGGVPTHGAVASRPSAPTSTSTSAVQSRASTPGHPPAPISRPLPAPPQPVARPAPPQPVPKPPPQPAVIPSYPVAIEFVGQGSSVDRFLFPPPNSILEPLGFNSLLVSFLVSRRGNEAFDNLDIKTLGPRYDAQQVYYEPVTVQIDVDPEKVGSRDILEYMQRAVKPAVEVRAYMRARIREWKRAEMRSLALRLPVVSTLSSEQSEALEGYVPFPGAGAGGLGTASGANSRTATPGVGADSRRSGLTKAGLPKGKPGPKKRAKDGVAITDDAGVEVALVAGHDESNAGPRVNGTGPAAGSTELGTPGKGQPVETDVKQTAPLSASDTAPVAAVNDGDQTVKTEHAPENGRSQTIESDGIVDAQVDAGTAGRHSGRLRKKSTRISGMNS